MASPASSWAGDGDYDTRLHWPCTLKLPISDMSIQLCIRPPSFSCASGNYNPHPELPVPHNPHTLTTHRRQKIRAFPLGFLPPYVHTSKYLHEVSVEGDTLAGHGVDEPAVHREPKLRKTKQRDDTGGTRNGTGTTPKARHSSSANNKRWRASQQVTPMSEVARERGSDPDLHETKGRTQSPDTTYNMKKHPSGVAGTQPQHDGEQILASTRLQRSGVVK